MPPSRRVVWVDVDAADVAVVEFAADVLWRAEPSAVSMEERPDGSVRLTADVSDLTVLNELPSGVVVQVVEIDDHEHLDAWRLWAQPVRAGQRVVVHPAWLPVDPLGPDDIVVRVDPGRAFGSGSHPSTRLVITAIEQHLTVGDRVLDVGTGSGVLGITACLLGAADALAIDIDPLAVAVVAGNARVNGVADRVHVSTIPLAAVMGVFDLVLANIGAAVLREMAPELLRCTAPSGHLVLAGLLHHQVDDVVASLPECAEVERIIEDEWTAVVLRLPQ